VSSCESQKKTNRRIRNESVSSGANRGPHLSGGCGGVSPTEAAKREAGPDRGG